MTVKRGSEVLIGREDATYAGSYNIIGGQRSGEIQFDMGSAESTSKTSAGLWQEFMDGGTVRRISLDGGGVVVDDSDLDAIFAAVMGASTRHQELAFLLPGLGMIHASFHVPSFQTTGELDQPEEFTIRCASTGTVVHVPGVTSRYDMRASLVLDFINASYWTGGAHSADFDALSDVTTTRASKAWADNYDGTDGGIFGDLVEFAVDATRIDTLGLLTEGGVTNEIRNARFEGGTPGDLSGAGVPPTNMLIGAAGGLTWTLDEVGLEDGNPYMQLSAAGTWSGDARIDLEQATQIAAADGDFWTVGMGARLVSGALGADFQIGVFERTGAGATVASQLETKAIDASRRRFWKASTLAGGGTVGAVSPVIYFDNGVGTVAFVIRLYSPQIENYLHASSPVLPTIASPAATTRAFEVIEVAGGSWINSAAAHSLVAEVSPRISSPTGYSASTPFVVGMADVDYSEYLYCYQSGANFINRINAAGAGILSGNHLDSVVLGQAARIAISYADNDMHEALGGDSTASSSSGAFANQPISLRLGNIGGSFWQGRIRKVSYLPYSLSAFETADSVEL